MSKVLVLHTMGFVLGIIMGNLLLVPVGAAFALAAAAFLFSLIVIIGGWDFKWLILFTLFMGMFWGQTHDPRISPYPLISGETIQVKGVVTLAPRSTASGQIFLLSLEEVEGKPIPRMKVQVLAEGKDQVHYGDVLNLRGEVLPGSTASNPGQFDYDQYLKRQGIFYTISTLYGGQVVCSGENRGHIFLKGVVKLKEKMDLVMAELPPRQSSFIGGMLFGIKGDLTFKEKNVLSQTGLMDAFAVSGVHVGYVVLFTLYFGGVFRLNKWGRLILVSLAVLFYAALSEFTPSVLRSGSMALLGLLAYSIGEEKDFFTGMALVALAILIWNPATVYDAGFQLSFAAAGGVVYLTPAVAKWLPQKTWGQLLAAALAAQLAIMPLIAYYFNIISLSGILVGIITTPLVGLVVLLGLCSVMLSIFSTWLAVLPAYGAGLTVEGIWWGAQLVSSLPGSYLMVKTPSLFLLALFYGCLLIWRLLTDMKKEGDLSFLIPIILVVVLALPVFSDGRLKVTFIDVGQGDSILLQSPAGRTCLIDGGGKLSQSGVDHVGEQIVIPFLKNMGLRKLDLAILSHPHDDHMLGLLTVMEELPVDQFVVAEKFLLSPELQPLLEIARKKQTGILPVYQGQEIVLDQGIHLKVLYPDEGEAPVINEANNNSLVLKLVYREQSFLFTGDVEMDTLSILSRQEGLKTQVLKVPHHGSKTGLHPEFYEQVAPEMAVICVGKNSFGHPNKDLLQFLWEKEIAVYRTDQKGAISFMTDGHALWVDSFFH